MPPSVWRLARTRSRKAARSSSWGVSASVRESSSVFEFSPAECPPTRDAAAALTRFASSRTSSAWSEKAEPSFVSFSFAFSFASRRASAEKSVFSRDSSSTDNAPYAPNEDASVSASFSVAARSAPCTRLLTGSEPTPLFAKTRGSSSPRGVAARGGARANSEPNDTAEMARRNRDLAEVAGASAGSDAECAPRRERVEPPSGE
mmetsp:Transcript_441/g.1691  ORF Transcript_441/g.1691 Transcript_441/m.1691 type:complete len:204 (+) Transcript_441:550-1161(+)